MLILIRNIKFYNNIRIIKKLFNNNGMYCNNSYCSKIKFI